MSEEEVKTDENLSDEEAILKIAQAMKDNAPAVDEKVNVHTFLLNVVQTPDSRKVGNLRDDKEYNELGKPQHSVRGNFDQALIAEKIMNNKFFAGYLNQEAENTLATSLSREATLIRLATTQTRQVADITKRRTKNKGMFKSTTTSQGGDTIVNQGDKE